MALRPLKKTLRPPPAPHDDWLNASWVAEGSRARTAFLPRDPLANSRFRSTPRTTTTANDVHLRHALPALDPRHISLDGRILRRRRRKFPAREAAPLLPVPFDHASPWAGGRMLELGASGAARAVPGAANASRRFSRISYGYNIECGGRAPARRLDDRRTSHRQQSFDQ